jgi:hypothetical protein
MTNSNDYVQAISSARDTLKNVDASSLRNMSASEVSQWKPVIEELYSKVSEVRSSIESVSDTSR